MVEKNDTEPLVSDAHEMARQFATNHPSNENVGTFYDGLDPAAYD